MRLLRSRSLVAVVTLSLAWALVSGAAPGAAPSTQPSTAPALQSGPVPKTADEATNTLTGKGLNKQGAEYVLKAEKEISDGMRSILAAKKKMDDENRVRTGVEKNIKNAKNAYAGWDFERRGYLEKLSTVKDPTQNNNLVAKIEGVSAKMKEAVQYKDEQEAKLKGLGTGRDDFVNQVLEMGTKLDKTMQEYADLAKLDDVKAALPIVKGKLGPSAAFAGQAAQLRRLRTPIMAETIKVEFEGEVPHVDVTLNGSFTRSMVFDSGASMIAIPADMAKQMELVPANTDPTIRLQLADGKIVEARQTTLKSVRVGTFTVENVECALLPPDLVAAQPLLGGSYLKNFIYKLDRGKSELHLARIGGGDAPGAGTAKPDPKKPAGK